MEKSVHFVGACYICVSQCAVKKNVKLYFCLAFSIVLNCREVGNMLPEAE
jgi:hypothetical protein